MVNKVAIVNMGLFEGGFVMSPRQTDVNISTRISQEQLDHLLRLGGGRLFG